MGLQVAIFRPSSGRTVKKSSHMKIRIDLATSSLTAKMRAKSSRIAVFVANTAGM